MFQKYDKKLTRRFEVIQKKKLEDRAKGISGLQVCDKLGFQREGSILCSFLIKNRDIYNTMNQLYLRKKRSIKGQGEQI